jgi:predicted RNA-binding Zn-ribbon protein involved in translation (DUF1610 family)
MVKEELICTSCKVKLVSATGVVKFKCPSCNKQDIIRCSSCRKKAIKYVCSNCSFEGPN